MTDAGHEAAPQSVGLVNETWFVDLGNPYDAFTRFSHIIGSEGKAMTDPADMTDAELLVAYQRTDGEPGNAEADALLAEIARRNLDI